MNKKMLMDKLIHLNFNDGRKLLIKNGYDIIVQCFNDLSNSNTEYLYCFSKGDEEIRYSINTDVNIKDIIWR